MTRKEEIRNAIDTIIPILPSENGRTYEQSLMATGFEAGAGWADANPNKNLVYTKKELLDMGFGFDLNGNISTPQEIEERAKKYINYRKAKWIEEACKWLEQHQENYDMYDAWDFIIDICKAMEE